MTLDDDWRRFRTTGDPAALGAVFDAVSPELFRVALALAPDAASAEDALQETWLVALASADRHDPARPLVPWLAGILRRKVHEVRRRGRAPDARRVHPRGAPSDPSIDAESAEELARLRAAIDALPAAYREIAVLRWRYGLEPGEIADARGMPPGTVRSLLHRALVRLRRSFRVAPALLLGAPLPRGLGDVRRTVLRAAVRQSAASATLTTAGGLLMAKVTKTAVVALAACLLLGAGAIVQLTGQRRPAPTSVPESAPADAARVAVTRVPTSAATSAAAPDDTAATARPFARGLVVDESGAPVAGCRVIVRGHEDQGGVQDAPVRLDANAAAVTGADGRFVVPTKPDDLASLTFVAEGFESVEERSFDADLRVVLARCGSFEARVVDTSGAPMAGVDVRVIGAWIKSAPRWTNVWLRADTDADGRLAFPSLPREARLTSMAAWGWRVRGAEFGSLPVQDEYVMERTSLVVDVTDSATGAPLTGARGLLVGSDGALLGSVEPQLPIASTAARAGRLFWSRDSRAGDFAAELRVFAPGHHVLVRPIAIAADAEPPLLSIELDAGDDEPVVAGRIADGAGALVEARFTPKVDGRKIVYGTDLRLPIAASVTADADGSFRIAGIPRAGYRLTVTRSGEVPLVLDVDAPATALDLRFAPKSALTVRYVDTKGVAIPGGWIHVESPGSNFSWCLPSDANGLAEFDALPAAEVVVLPLHNTGVFLQTGGVAALASFQPLPSAVRTLTAGGHDSLVLTRPDPCRVTVLVKDDGGRPVPDVEIHAKATYGFGFWLAEERDRLPLLDLTTDADGRASFDVLPCRGEVKALRQGRVNSTKFVAGIGSSPTVEIVLPSVTGTIRGRVLERGTGAPVAGRPVTVWWDHTSIAQSVTGDDGRFVASGVPAGRVSVSVAGGTDANDPQQRRVDPTSPYRHAEVEFEMTAGEDHAVADIALPRVRGRDAEAPVTVVDVTVVDDAGAPVAKAWVRVMGRIAGAWCSVAADSSAQTGDDGRVRLDVIAAERYRVGASAGERAVAVEREPGASLVERLVLPAK